MIAEEYTGAAKAQKRYGSHGSNMDRSYAHLLGAAHELSRQKCLMTHSMSNSMWNRGHQEIDCWISFQQYSG